MTDTPRARPWWEGGSCTPERAPDGHQLVLLTPSVYACLEPHTTRLHSLWEWHGTYLSSPLSYSAVRSLGQRAVDDKLNEHLGAPDPLVARLADAMERHGPHYP